MVLTGFMYSSSLKLWSLLPDYIFSAISAAVAPGAVLIIPRSSARSMRLCTFLMIVNSLISESSRPYRVFLVILPLTMLALLSM